MEGVQAGEGGEWKEESGPGLRRWVRARPSGYEACVVVRGDLLSARLWRPRESKDVLSVAPHPVRPEEVEHAVAELKAAIDRELAELESGHS
jgi:hypothetical protein